MKPSEYLIATGQSVNGFAKLCGLPQRTLNDIVHGAEPRAGHASRIIATSRMHPTDDGQWIELDDLVAAPVPPAA